MKATKKPVTVEYYPFERKYHKQIMEWSTDVRPISISTPRCPDGIAVMTITTLEGTMTAREKEGVIIKGVNGEVYPCKKDIFEKTYEYE